MRRGALRWRSFLFTTTEDGNGGYDVVYRNAIQGGRLALAIYGDTFDEYKFSADTGAEGAAALSIDNSVNKNRWVERIVGDITYRGFAFNGAVVGAAGSNPIWLVRTGVVVLASDGQGAVPEYLLGLGSAVGGPFSSDDIELNWMFLEQFAVCGADLPSTEPGTSSPSTDGLNHYAVDRHYDIRVGRNIGPHDLLVWQTEVSLAFYTAGHSSAPAEAVCVHYTPMLRMLAT